MEFFRTGAKLRLSTWDKHKKAFIELIPAIDPNMKGQPKPGEKRYAYDKAIRISFTGPDLLTGAFKFIGMSHGIKCELEKFADLSKSTHVESNDKKKLTVKPLDNSTGISIYITEGAKKANINLSFEESYAIGKWFETAADYFIKMDIAEDNARASANEQPQE